MTLVAVAVVVALSVSGAEPPSKQVRLAAPAFRGVNMKPEVLAFLSDHFAQQLTAHGLSVTTAEEISTVLGLERQKQLLQCDDSSACMVELSQALGVDGIVSGSIANFDGKLVANIKVLGARDARPLAVLSRQAQTEGQLLEALTAEAPEVAAQVSAALGAKVVPTRTTLRHVVSVGPVNLLLGLYGLEYEYLLSPLVGLFVEPRLVRFTFPAFLLSSGIVQGDDGRALNFLQLDGLDLKAGARFYFPATAPQGFYVAPHVSVGSMTVTEGSAGETPTAHGGTSFAIGASIGASGVVAGHVVISVGVGAEWTFSGDSGPPGFGRLSVGWAF